MEGEVEMEDEATYVAERQSETEEEEKILASSSTRNHRPERQLRGVGTWLTSR